jgi:branched-chain amino acid transport system ATP-binding protein
MTSPALSVEDLHSGYGKTEILSGVGLHVAEGECVGLIGPNGHGKTTLLRTISGLDPAPWSGAVHLGGTKVTRLPARRLVELGLVHAPQGDALFTDLSVEEHLALASRGLRRPDRQSRLRDIYGLFPRLDERRKQRARTLSGGERRMLSIARMLLLDGKVHLVDEPSLGLSPKMVHEVYSQIAALVGRGLTVLIVEENPSRLRGLAERIYLLDRGTVVASGGTEELLRDASLVETYLGVADSTATSQ